MNIKNKGDEKNRLLLTPLQQGILFQTHYEEEDLILYHNQVIMELNELVNASFLESAIQQTIQRYATLRCGFSLEESTALIHPKVPFKLAQADYSSFSEEQQKKRIKHHILKDKKRPFDLKKPPLMRFKLIQLNSEKFQLVLTYHHIAFGGNGTLAIIKDLFTYYDALLGKPIALPAPLDDCERYMSALKMFDHQQAKTYWQTLLNDYDEPCKLPEKLNKPLAQASEHRAVSFDLGENSLEIRKFCRSHSITPNLFFHLVWGLLLQYYCDRDHIVFGISKEFPKRDIGNQAGLFFNTLPISLRFTENTSIEHIIEQLREQHHQISKYLYTPLHQIKALTPLSPLESLFYSMIDFKTYSPNAYLLLEYPYWENRNIYFESNNEYPLFVEVYGTEKSFLGRITYQAKNFDADFIDQIMHHFENIITQLISLDSNYLTNNISPLTETEKNILIKDWNQTQHSDGEHTSDLFSLFEHVALKHPNNLAFIDKDQELTYIVAYAQVNHITNYLRACGVSNINDRVILCLPRCNTFPMTVLALQKLQATYIPLDTEMPHARMQAIIEDCKPVLMLSTPALFTHFKDVLPKNMLQLSVESFKKKITKQQTLSPLQQIKT